MKKVVFLIIGLLILGVIFVGCNGDFNLATPGTETECVNYLSRNTIGEMICEGFEEGFVVEQDITGLGGVWEYLDISCPGNDMTLKIIEEDGSFPGYNYRASDNSLKNNGWLNGDAIATDMGFSVVSANSWSLGDPLDFDKIVFNFINGVTVSDFSIYMLDYGDMCHNNYNGQGTHCANYTVTLTAYDKDGGTVNIYAYSINDSGGQGDITYDASKEAGRKTLSVTGSGIAKVEMVFTEGIDLGIGFDDICFTVEPIEVPLDIKPTSCPNPLNTKSNGVIPVAILGTEDFDITEIDPATVRLQGILPLRWALEDVATPFELYIGKTDCDNDCNTLGPDGYTDLTLKFDAKELINVFGADTLEITDAEVTTYELEDGACLVLKLTGELYDGIPIYGEDVVRILKKGK